MTLDVYEWFIRLRRFGLIFNAAKSECRVLKIREKPFDVDSLSFILTGYTDGNVMPYIILITRNISEGLTLFVMPIGTTATRKALMPFSRSGLEVKD
jgi:hypothetical protein